MGRDMKNRFFKNIARVFAIVAGCLILASFSPSLDGRAIVVDEGVFPSGLFAKTVGYLPGDIISVTNITGDATIDILVIGALDPSEGVAIMLSPEAATAIGMDKEANNIVKITKRSNQDERVYGTAIIARQDGNTTIPAVTVPDNEVPAKEESFANVEPATENEFNVGNQETTIDNSEPDDETPEVIEDVADDNSEGVIVEEINNGEEYVPDEEWEDDSYEESDDLDDSDDEYSEDIYEDNNEVEDSENDKVEELEEEIKEEEIAAEEYEEEYLPEEDVEAEEYTEDDYIPEDDDITDYEEETETDDFDEDYIETEVADDYDDVIEEEYTEEDIPADEEFIEEEYIEEDIPADEEFIEEEFNEDAEEVLEVEDESEAEIEDPIEEEFEEFEDELVEDAIQDDAEEYDAIVLVPAEENISSVIEKTESLEAENEVVEEIVEETEVAEEIEEVILEEVQQIVEETKTVETNTSYSKYVVPNMSDLKKGSYYIQIAVLKSDENILEVTNKYGKKYPLTIVPNADGTKKVMVGPLCVDEYGTVLERFKSYGYKDAFTRKIN